MNGNPYSLYVIADLRGALLDARVHETKHDALRGEALVDAAKLGRVAVRDGAVGRDEDQDRGGRVSGERVDRATSEIRHAIGARMAGHEKEGEEGEPQRLEPRLGRHRDDHFLAAAIQRSIVWLLRQLLAEVPVARLGDDDRVLDADAEVLLRNVDPGLDRDDGVLGDG